MTAETVLTAAHVVRGASKVRVRFDADQAGEWSADVTGGLEVPEIDVALLTITPPDAAKVVPAPFGRIGERDAVIECSAVGFPLWKLRDDPAGPYRDSAHVVGGAAILANRREGTLEITVAPPERDPDPEVSPWQGMSGAAVFCNGQIVGIVSRHHRSDGLGRLAASRVDGWQKRVSPAQLRKMNARLGLPEWLRKLGDVIAPSLGELIQSAYLAQVRDIAPENLMGRQEELAELVAFCAGSEAYQWWRGDPWAGKTALAAWFVLHPPVGVQIASFFITARLDDQSDSAAFTEAMIDQLAVIAGEPIIAGTSAAARDGLRRHLIEAAAARLRERGERLVLVVDGLDEDTSARPGSGRASIASLLPRQSPDGVRILVTSREEPPLPADVPQGHPLRTSRERKLAALPFASSMEQAAETELRLRLHADSGDREVIALITAAGGGLTVSELAELTGRLHFEIQDRLSAVLGRSLYSRVRYDAEPEGAHERVYLFAHETLRAAADKILHADLGRYRDEIHAWADKYRTLGWPESTPRYLLRPYGRLLTASGDVRRLAVIAADRARHNRMLQRTGGDGTALAEIAQAQDLLLGQPVPDLEAMARLAIRRTSLAERNANLDPCLPAVWAAVGSLARADALVGALTNPDRRSKALTDLVTAVAATGDLARARVLAQQAETVARTITGFTGPQRQAKALTDLVTAVAATGDLARARVLAQQAERVACTITESDTRSDALISLVKVAIAAGDLARAEAVTHSLTAPKKWEAVTLLVRAVATAGDLDRAEALARSIDGLDWRWEALGSLVEGVAAARGDLDRAETVTRSIDDPYQQARALTALAGGWATGGNLTHARSLIEQADTVARTSHPYQHPYLLTALAKVSATARDPKLTRT